MKLAFTWLALAALFAVDAFADQSCIDGIATQLAALNTSSIFLEVVDTWTTSADAPAPEPAAMLSEIIMPCPAIYSPVCGVDGQTYDNSCVAESRGSKVACEGSCPCAAAPAPEPVVACPLIWAPVCSATGDVYGNECAARGSGVHLFCDGECPCKNPLDLLTRGGGYLLVPTDVALEATASSSGINADLLSNPALWVSRAALVRPSGEGTSLLAMDGAAFNVTISPNGDVTAVDGPSDTAAVLEQAQACNVTILVLDAVPYSLL